MHNCQSSNKAAVARTIWVCWHCAGSFRCLLSLLAFATCRHRLLSLLPINLDVLPDFFLRRPFGLDAASAGIVRQIGTFHLARYEKNEGRERLCSFLMRRAKSVKESFARGRSLGLAAWPNPPQCPPVPAPLLAVARQSLLAPCPPANRPQFPSFHSHSHFPLSRLCFPFDPFPFSAAHSHSSSIIPHIHVHCCFTLRAFTLLSQTPPPPLPQPPQPTRKLHFLPTFI